jgi:hypothetical protein
MLYYLNQPFAKDLAGSFRQLATMDQRRNLDSGKVFTNLYKLREEINHGKTV